MVRWSSDMNFIQDSLSGRESEALGEALNQIWEAVAMLSPTWRIVYANRAAAQILHRGAGIALSPDGRLITANRAAREAVGSALSDGITPSPVAVPRSGQPPLVLSLQPLPPALQGNTEARLAQSVSEGTSLKQIAGANHITYETVRTHLRRILSKMGARRQVELVRIAHALR
jgi:DNA-binding CsgD family transcriptional regulator